MRTAFKVRYLADSGHKGQSGGEVMLTSAFRP